jgi:sulfite exporter TauE/SafE
VRSTDRRYYCTGSRSTSVEIIHTEQLITITTYKESVHGELGQRLSKLVQDHGYEFVDHYVLSSSNQSSYSEYAVAIIIGIGLLACLVLLQKSGLLNLGIGGIVTPVTAVIVGLVASVSSCLAVVGGLVLSLSAKLSIDNQSDKRAFAQFHIGRVLGFGLLGGVLGLLGELVAIHYTVTAVLGIIAAVIMLMLGLDMVGVKSAGFRLPDRLFRFMQQGEATAAGPLLFGVGTFFLPCGFTQSMQVAALGSGSILIGALIMFGFAVGTLPVLLVLTYGSGRFVRSKYSSVFLKTVGVVVIGMGLISVLSGLAVFGIIRPLNLI